MMKFIYLLLLLGTQGTVLLSMHKKSVMRINMLKIVSSQNENNIQHKSQEKMLVINGKSYNYSLASKNKKRAVYWDGAENELFEKKRRKIGSRIKTVDEESNPGCLSLIFKLLLRN